MTKIDVSAIISPDSKIGDDILIYKNVRVLSSSLCGNNSIGDFSTVRDSVLEPYVSIQRNCDILRCNIGRYTIIEKNAVLHIGVGIFKGSLDDSLFDGRGRIDLDAFDENVSVRIFIILAFQNREENVVDEIQNKDKTGAFYIKKGMVHKNE